MYGQEINQRTWQLAKMNVDLHGMASSGIGHRWADTFAEDLLPGLTADFVLAVPPFNISDWAPDEFDPRWRYGVPPSGNANFALNDRFARMPFSEYLDSRMCLASDEGQVTARRTGSGRPSW